MLSIEIRSNLFWENTKWYYIYISHLADAFIQSDLQMRTIEAIKNQQKSIYFEDISVFFVSGIQKNTGPYWL